MYYSPDTAHEAIMAAKPMLAFDEKKPFAEQKKAIYDKLRALLGDEPKRVPLNPTVEETIDHDTYTEHRIAFDVEEGVQAICLLCIPKNLKGKAPLFIALQGHSTGKHVSMGRKLFDDDTPGRGDRDYAMQAIERGYVALSLDQRGMGERRTEKVWPDKKNDGGSPRCDVTAMTALLSGRTMIGERCWDVSRAIDLALTYPEVDPDRIIVCGNSGGGTTTYYAACMDERIKVAMPSCSVCTFRDSIGAMPHCVCNFVPGICKYLDMGDMAAAIAPRKLIIINGKEDIIFPHHGVLETFDKVKKIYAAAGVPDNCALATGAHGHRFYKKEAWEAFDRIVGWN